MDPMDECKHTHVQPYAQSDQRPWCVSCSRFVTVKTAPQDDAGTNLLRAIFEEQPLAPDVMMDPMDVLLYNSCSNPAPAPWRSGFNVYNFTGHCVEFDVYAEPYGDGTYLVAHVAMKARVTDVSTLKAVKNEHTV